MTSSKPWTFVLLGMFLCCMIGCSGNVQVNGKVVFSDDGSPLDVGMILFESGDTVSRGTINGDGTFNMGFEKQNDGMPPGTYNVSISNAVRAEGDMRAPQIIPLVATKFSSGSTSGITITVDRSLELPLEIKVDRFGTGN